MSLSKGQGATEYLVILGAVLLVALVVVNLLGWFPSLGAATRDQQSRSYWSGASPFSINVLRVNNSSVTFSAANKLSDKLNLTAVDIRDGLGNNYVIMTPNQVFNSGEEIAISNYTFNATFGNPCNAASSTAGKPFEFKIVGFTYTQGSISGIRQHGAQALSGRCS
jgi:hypothetical protein